MKWKFQTIKPEKTAGFTRALTSIVGVHFGGFWNLPLMSVTIILVLLSLVYWNRPAKQALGRWSRRLLLLRFPAAFILLLFVFNPTLIFQKTGARKGLVAMLIDTSRSMERKDSTGGLARLDSVKRLLGETSFISDISKWTEPSFFTFHSNVQPLADARKIQDLRAQGESTNLADALNHLRRNSPREGWTGVILFTDGRSTANDSAPAASKSLGCPVYVVGVGRKSTDNSPLTDVGILRMEANPTAILNQPTTLRLGLLQQGMSGAMVTVRLKEGENVLAEKNGNLTEEGEQKFSLEFTPRKKGLRQLSLEILKDPRDLIPENNKADFTLPVTDARLKVLYVEGTLRWEYKFLKRTLTMDPFIEPTLLLRTTADQAFQQSGGEALKDGFPTSPDALSKFDVIILGDIPRAFLSDEQVLALETFVGDRGGGLIITGGYHILCSGEYAQTPLTKLLPVQPATTNKTLIQGEFSLEAEPHAKTHEILKGIISNLSEVRLERWYPVGGAKAGAEVLLRRRGKTGETGIFLAIQPYGKGRVLFLASDDLWRLSFRRKKQDEPGVGDLIYLQGARWVARQDISDDKTAPLFLPHMDRFSYEPGSAATLHVQWNKGRLGEENPKMEGTLLHGGNVETTLDFIKKGAYDFTVYFNLTKEGKYEVSLKGSMTNQSETQSLKFLVGRPWREMESLSIDETTLRAIAQETSGGYYTLLNAGEIAKRLPKDIRVERSRIEKEATSGPGWFIAFFLLMCLEWFLRRRRGLI
jgi:hypothetical protein